MKFLQQGLGEEAAVEAALQEAKAKREELVRQGMLQPPKLRTAPPASLVRGVSYRKDTQKWQVCFRHNAAKKWYYGGTFQAQEQAEAKAREMAMKLGIPADVEVVPAKSSQSCSDGKQRGGVRDSWLSCKPLSHMCGLARRYTGTYTHIEDVSGICTYPGISGHQIQRPL